MDERQQKGDEAMSRSERDRRRRRLQPVRDSHDAATGRTPRTIGRLIAQTALLADSALIRRAVDRERPRQRNRFGWFL